MRQINQDQAVQIVEAMQRAALFGWRVTIEPSKQGFFVGAKRVATLGTFGPPTEHDQHGISFSRESLADALGQLLTVGVVSVELAKEGQ